MDDISRKNLETQSIVLWIQIYILHFKIVIQNSNNNIQIWNLIFRLN
jgi:hypothetical protein